MDMDPKEEQLRREIEERIEEIYKTRKENEKFIPGTSRVNYAGRVYDEKEIKALVNSSIDFWLTLGPECMEFEKRMAEFLGMKKFIVCNSGSSANLLAISALCSKFIETPLKPGDEVITIAASFPTTLTPIIQNNLIPVFVDVELETYNIDIEEIEKAISPKTRAIFFAHTLGNPAKMDRIMEIAKKHNLYVIEDNCIDGNRCSVVRIDGEIMVLTIKEIYNIFKSKNYKSFEILSHGDIIKENDLYKISDEFKNILSKKQLKIIERYKRFLGDVDKIITELKIKRFSYYNSKCKINKKMKNFCNLKPKWVKVKNVIFKGKRDSINVTQNFGETCVTHDHIIKIFENNKIKDINMDDFIKRKKRFINLLLTENAKKSEVDLAKYFKKFFQKNGSVKYDNKWIWFDYNKKCWKGKLSKLPKIKRHYRGNSLKALCTLFGLYCSEGNSGHELRLSFTNYNYVKLVVKLIKSISNLDNIRISTAKNNGNKIIRGVKVNSNKTIYSVNLGHELFNIVFSALGGTNSYNKRVPNFIFNLDAKYMKIFYDYYIKGDGCKKSQDEIDFTITTASLKMASGINLLNNLIFKKFSRLVISKNKYYDVSPVKSLKYLKKEFIKRKSIKNTKIYDIVVEDTSTFVDACGNVLLHNCDALDSRYDGKLTGNFGDISTYSFYCAHHITGGEGGGVATNNPKIARAISSLRDWGRDCFCQTGEKNPLGACNNRFSHKFPLLPDGYDHKYVYSNIGYNLKPLDLQCAILIEQLKKLPEFSKIRKENFKKLYECFKKFEDKIILPKSYPKSEPSWFSFPITVKENSGFKRADIIKFLEEKNIETRMLFGGNILKQPGFCDIKCRVIGELKNTDIILNNTFFLGVYPGITKEKMDYMIKCIDEFFEKTI